MRIAKYLAASTAILAAPYPVSAATYVMAFNSGVGYVTPPPVTAAATGLSDTFLFDTAQAMTFSGLLSTQRSRGTAAGNLDFVSVILDGIYAFALPSAISKFDQARLDLASIAAGSHSLVVTYNVTSADSSHGAGYVGMMSLADAATDVPEPATWAMMFLGLGLTGITARRRAARSVAA